jgi:hypothetical protein
MEKKVEKYIKKRNKTNYDYLTINRYDFDMREYHKGIVGIVDLIEFNLIVKINCENNKITNLINLSDNVKYINCIVFKISYTTKVI